MIRPAEYWGLNTIGERCGVTRQTILHWMVDKGFPMWLRRKPKRACREWWYTNESLIVAWELGMAAQARENYIKEAADAKFDKKKVVSKHVLNPDGDKSGVDEVIDPGIEALMMKESSHDR